MKKYWAIMAVTATSVAFSGCAGPAASQSDGPAGSHADHQDRTPTGGEPYHGMIQYRAKDAKVAIVKPNMLDGDKAIIAAGTAVIGVSVGGEARAYPLYILNNHQVVNDYVGGIPLSASW